MSKNTTQVTLKHINEKLKHIHKLVEQNSKDIIGLKEQMAMGRGGLTVVVWFGAIMIAILGVIKIKGFL